MTNNEETPAATGVSGERQPNKVRVTTPYLTKYERARILGTRALQIRWVTASLCSPLCFLSWVLSTVWTLLFLCHWTVKQTLFKLQSRNYLNVKFHSLSAVTFQTEASRTGAYLNSLLINCRVTVLMLVLSICLLNIWCDSYWNSFFVMRSRRAYRS